MQEVRHERALAKLTRTFAVTGRRADGYHLVSSEMVTLDLGDDLEIAPLPGGTDDPSLLEVVDSVAWVGDARPGGGGETAEVPSGEDNLVVRALALAGRRARVRLVKRIPAGAGLGGGSADAAAVLRWAGFDDPTAASRLGADVPFCVVGGRAIVAGIGEEVDPLEPDDASYVLLTPATAVATALVYRAFDEVGAGPAAGRGPNDLERAALLVEPRLARPRDLLAEVSACTPVLAGSGSTWFVECADDRAESLRAEVAAAVVADGGRATVNVGRTTGPFAR
ncbi:MAG: 4-(cytidine 5'-diphospho)-2-C-methyl-D-erythritol kinase [Actinomycetota bacterium]|nr:4-(cytidine 5'-diphospho)-2-C-methyl-D-erythritol kinase [Actinomycetota bacterium]